MNANDSVLAHIAPMVGAGEENLATTALCFVLGRSTAANAAFVQLLSQALERPLPALRFRTQASNADGTIPDMVGTDEAGRPVVYVESKFWAGLTDAQPVAYLERLRREGGVGLVVLAPANRLATLWPELVRRCKEADIGPTTPSQGDRRLLQSSLGPALALTSWSVVLAELMHATEVAGDAPATEDLRQLGGLCAKMEEAGFLPLRSEELTGNVARRIGDYCGLVDDLTAELVASGLASTQGLKATGGRGYYGRYVVLKGNGAQIAFHAGWWAKEGASPLWLWLRGPAWRPSPAIHEAVRPLLAADPPRIVSQDDGTFIMPLILPTGCERPDVLAALVHQVRALCDLLPEAHGFAQPPQDAAEVASEPG